MNVFRNILAVILGFVIGALVNMGVIAAGHALMPPPAGFDGSSMEGVASTIHLLQPIDFIVPFLAHALGPFAGVLHMMMMESNPAPNGQATNLQTMDVMLQWANENIPNPPAATKCPQ